MKINLVTYQTKEAVDVLMRNGVLRLRETDREKTSLAQFNTDGFPYAYRFMRCAMEQRLPPPDFADTYYPIWAWHTIEGEQPPTTHLDEIHKGKMRLILEIDEERLLLSDFDMFSYILGGGLYFATSGAEKKKYKNRFQEPDEFFYPNLEQMFTLHRKQKTPYAFSYREETIQATFWELYLEDVIEITEV